MANPEHVRTLKQGQTVWNKWFKQNLARGLPDLSEADLSDTDLSGTDLRGVNLKKAILIRANLSGAKLSGANLSESFLFRATLREAEVRGASLNGADICEADLQEAILSNSYLIGAILTRANLNAAQLVETDFKGADLRGVDFRKADLTGANLTGADLTGADLTEANCSKADFERANLSTASLTNARFSDAQLYSTIFGSNDLSQVVEIRKVIRYGPSILSMETIYKSKGKIPQGFLRGCGLSDLQIETAELAAPGLDPKQVADITDRIRQSYLRGIQYASCFISYNSKDEEFATRLHVDLQSEGVRCWLAPEDLKVGDKFRNHTEDAIRGHDKLLIVFSDNSIFSPVVEKEVLTVFELERKAEHEALMPIRLDRSLMEAEQHWAEELRSTRQIADFSDQKNYQKVLNGLLKELKSVNTA